MFEIEITPTTGGRFKAYVETRLLVKSSRTPFLAAARVLANEGAQPDTKIQMRHRGSQTVSLISTIGVAAKLTVDESSKGGAPRFKKWQPVPDGVAEDSVLEETARVPRPSQNNASEVTPSSSHPPTSKIDTMGDVVPLRLAVTL
jgi:hypothetical protein